MKIRRFDIAGFGRLVGRAFEPAPGLTLYFAANEGGKTTVLRFITSMLYGMVRADIRAQRRPDPRVASLKPWRAGAPFGGSIQYELSVGKRFEIVRDFDDGRHGMAEVFDRSAGARVTDLFDHAGNRELLLMEAQLGLSKAAFAATAVIGHDALGRGVDDASRGELRDRIAALADSVDEDVSADQALRLLEEALAEIGTERARKGSPLGKAAGAVEDLERERDAIRARRARYAELTERLATLASELAEIDRTAAEAGRVLDARARRALAERCAELEKLDRRVGALAERRGALRVQEALPDGTAERFVRLLARVATQRREFESAERAAERARAHCEALIASAGPLKAFADADEETFAQIDRLSERLRRLVGEFERLRDEQDNAEREHRALEIRAEELRDRTAEDGRWRGAAVGQAFVERATLVRHRWHERAEADAVWRDARERAEGERFEVGVQAKFFEGIDRDLPERHDRYVEDLEALDELRAEIEPEVAAKAEAVARERRAKRRALWGLPVLTALASAGLYLGRTEPLLGQLGAALDVLVIASGVVVLWRMRAIPALDAAHATLADRLRRREFEFAQRHERIVAMARERGADRVGPIARQMRVWRDQSDRVRALEEEAEEAAEALARARAAADAEVERLRDWLRELELPFDGSGGEAELARVEEEFGARRAIVESRAVDTERVEAQLEEAKRRLVGIAGRLADARVAREDTWRELAGRLRALEISLDDPERLDQALALFRRSYADARELRTERRAAEAAAEAEAEALARRRAELEEAEAELAELLGAAGVETAEDFRAALDDEAELRRIDQERALLEARREALAGAEGADALRGRLAEIEARLGALEEAERREIESMDDETAAAAEARVAALARERQERHVEHERLAAQLEHFFEGERHPSAVEEDLAAARAQFEELRRRRDALEIARDTLREVAERSHARMATGLHEAVERLLPDLTEGRYDRVQVSPELEILVWNKDKGAGAWLPPEDLSHGTRDQIYFALRFGIAELLAGRGEPIPFLLDDPFVNYDRMRLEGAVALLERLGERNQILLFTCSSELRAIAEARGVRVEDL